MKLSNHNCPYSNKIFHSLVFYEMERDTTPIRLVWDKEPGIKTIRLALDIIKQNNPLFKNDKEFIAENVKQICKLNINKNKINNIRSFKKILFHNIIDNVNDKGQVIIKKVRRK